MDHQFSLHLEKEIPEWVRKKLLSSASAEKILAHVRSKTSEEENTASKLVVFLSIIGAAFVGLGCILYFAANWNEMSDILKFGILVVATVAISIAAYICLYVRGMPKTGHALALLGSILYGASIFLIGQIYHLGGTIPGAMLLWIAGVIPVAYISGLSGFSFLLSVLIFIWMIAEFGESRGEGENLIPFIPLAFGLFLSGIAEWHTGKFTTFSKIFSRIGFFFVFSSFFLFTFKDVLDTVSAFSHAAQILLGMGMIGILAYIANIFRNKIVSFGRDAVGITAIGAALFFTAMLTAPITTKIFGEWSSFHLATTIIANLFFVAFVFLALTAGTIRKSTFMINTSVFFITVFIFTKYFDWFFDMMDRALFFIFGGTLLVILGWFIERRRRLLIGAIQK